MTPAALHLMSTTELLIWSAAVGAIGLVVLLAMADAIFSRTVPALQTLAYLSDHGPTRAARQPHASLDADANRMSVSLDHSVWFHRTVDMNQWLLSELIPVATGRGRGLSIGTFRTSDGTLVATIAQEVLLRSR